MSAPRARTTPQAAPSGGGCSQYASAFAAHWQADHVAWAMRAASGETGGTCSLTIRNPAPCNRRGDHAVGIMQECGYSGPFTVDAELTAAWQLCLAQIDAWGYHGYCR